ncbi:hypothetical protein L1049_002392 [Liquidambar formosana]|uniref:GTD-binding domain-containing protein n=1 Tax=Liquidambar formosana TaxID=63359 RepID=A0AAP0R8U4_LIQFO
MQCLEWVLIFLLLLNSLFSYLITKFADYFGLKQPCLWCSRVDHILEPRKTTHSYRDLVCEAHATEISKLGYCSDHRRLAESHSMCKDCLSSRPKYNGKANEMSRTVAFFSWVKDNRTENDEKNNRCSCCNESLDSKLHSPFLMFKPSWGVLDSTKKGSLIIEAMDNDDNGGEYSDPHKFSSKADQGKNAGGIEGNSEDADGDENQIIFDIGSLSSREAAEENFSRSVSNFQCNEKEGNDDEEAKTPKITHQDSSSADFVHEEPDDITTQVCCRRDESLEMINLCSENYIDCDFNRLIPVELIDSSTAASQRSCNLREEDPEKNIHQNETTDSGSRIEIQVEVSEETALPRMNESAEETRYREMESLEMGETEYSSFLDVEEAKGHLVGRACEQIVTTQADQTLSSTDGNDVKAVDMEEPDDCPAAPEDSIISLGDENKSKIMTGSEVFDHGPANQTEAQEPISTLPCLQHQSSTNNKNVGISARADAFMAHNDQGPKQIEKNATIQEKTILYDRNEEGINRHLSMRSEPNEAEEEKLPDTPTSMEALNHLHKKLLLFEKRESGREESLDGSMVSETEGGDGVLSIERLEAALKAEHKALTALYAELEEERSASAIAANQTMAMITRLQEEKAAMQMEALQYQRMMEEQSEYDQEALQLLNELMIKREKEKQELEKELEIYRKKVLDYEAKEKTMKSRRRKDGSLRSRNSSASCSNAEDSDELSIDLNQEGRDEDSSFYGHQEGSNNYTPADANLNLEEMGSDCVKHLSTLDESLAEFEEERLSILDQLKALEEKLFTLGDDDQCFEDVKPIEHYSDYISAEFDENYHFSSQEQNGISNGISKDLNGKHFLERKTMGSKAKRLLPLFDAVDIETEELEQVESDPVGIQNSLVPTFELENKKLAIEEEVDHVYERLQALEADKEFLRHCVSSLKKGDKGMDLLQEILQHLRDLRTVELRVKTMGDGPLG